MATSKTPSTTPATPAAPPLPDHPESGGMRLWRRSEEFGPYLREVRERKRLSLGIAAHELGVSPTHLGRLERGERGRPPTVEFLACAANLFSVSLEEMLIKAGFTEAASPVGLADDELDARFANLFLFSKVRPPLADEPALNYYSNLQKRQIIHFAERLEAYLSNSLGRTWSVAELQMDPSKRPVADDDDGAVDPQPADQGNE